MILNKRQHNVAVQIRNDVSQVSDDDDDWGSKIDFLSNIAMMVEGMETLVNPEEMSKRFQATWIAYAKIWQNNAEKIVKNCLSPDEYERINKYPDVKVIQAVKGRILSRVQEVHGEITHNMNVTVEVKDIILDELGNNE